MEESTKPQEGPQRVPLDQTDEFVAEVNAASKGVLEWLLAKYENHPAGGSLSYYALILTLTRILDIIPEDIRWPLFLSGQEFLFFMLQKRRESPKVDA
jgi:hypothetical protein